jgi:hypothetical protein
MADKIVFSSAVRKRRTAEFELLDYSATHRSFSGAQWLNGSRVNSTLSGSFSSNLQWFPGQGLFWGHALRRNRKTRIEQGSPRAVFLEADSSR